MPSLISYWILFQRSDLRFMVQNTFLVMIEIKFTLSCGFRECPDIHSPTGSWNVQIIDILGVLLFWDSPNSIFLGIGDSRRLFSGIPLCFSPLGFTMHIISWGTTWMVKWWNGERVKQIFPRWGFTMILLSWGTTCICSDEHLKKDYLWYISSKIDSYPTLS